MTAPDTPGKRPGHVGERAAERLGLQHRADDQARERQRRRERPRAPARGGQPAVGEHPADRGHAHEDQRPSAVGDERPPTRRPAARPGDRACRSARTLSANPTAHEHARRSRAAASRSGGPAAAWRREARIRSTRRAATAHATLVASPSSVTRQRVEHGGSHEQDRDADGGDPRQTHPAIISARARAHNRATTGPEGSPPAREASQQPEGCCHFSGPSCCCSPLGPV